MQLLVIASFLAIYIYDFLNEPLLGLGKYVSTSGFVLCACLAGLAGIYLLLNNRFVKVLDRKGDSAAFTWNEISLLALQAAGCAAFYFAVVGLGWLQFIRDEIGNLVLIDEVIALLPLLAFASILWWVAYPVERRWYDALFNRWLYTGRPLFMPPSRRDFVLGKIRHTILFFAVPLTMLMGWKEFCDRKLPFLMGIGSAQGVPLKGLHEWQRYLPATVQLGGVAVILTIVPLLLVLIWDTVPLGPGALRDRLIGLCDQYGVGMRNLLVWRTHGTMANGAAMGMIRWVRYILLTDQLLESLPIPQVEAVMAHEVAHIKHRHILWLGITVLGTVFFTSGVIENFDRLMGSVEAPWIAATLASAFSVGSLGIVFMVFGLVSRRFEWQADAFAVRHMAASLPASGEIGDGDVGSHAAIVTPVAVAAMSDALNSVAELNGMRVRRPSFRHGSIHSRQVRLRKLVGLPRSEFPIDILCRRIKVAACAALTVGMALSAWDAYFTKAPPPDDKDVVSTWHSLSKNIESAN